ncbi:MAG: restriction endonuclease subunit S, partial [Staphylococcus sp.]|nr:restriction endonuclease subunit S [Staphylococcus sp.]
MEYKEILLKDLASKIGDGLHGTPSYDPKGNFYFVNGNNLEEGNIVIKDTTKTVNRETFEKYKKDLSKRTLLVSINGTIGKIAKFNNENIVLGKSACYINLNDTADKNYIYFLLKSREFQNYIQQYATGTTIKNVSLKTIRNFKVKLPALKYQNRVSTILQNIENKIQLNYKMIANLEELSQTLFKRWFIDFEFPDKDGNPYKSSGGEMIDSELGEMPKNWNILTINDFADDLIITGKTPSTKNKDNYSEKGIPFLTIPDMHTDVFSLNTIKYISEVGIEKVKNKIIPENSLCVSCIATPGLVSITSSETLTNQQINSFTPKKNDLYYLYFYIKNMKKYIEDLGSGGSATLNLNKTQFSKIKIIRPINDLLKKFHKCVDSNFKIILTKQKENLKLQELRDTLLP